MSSPFDISRFPDLPPEVLKAFEAQQAALEASRMEVEASRMEAIIERAARLHQEAIVTEKEGLIGKRPIGTALKVGSSCGSIC
jgi:transposase